MSPIRNDQLAIAINFQNSINNGLDTLIKVQRVRIIREKKLTTIEKIII